MSEDQGGLESPFSNAFGEPQREVNERNFREGLSQIIAKHSSILFDYHRIDTIKRVESDFYTEANLAEFRGYENMGGEIIAEEIENMKLRFDPLGLGITAEEALQRHNNDKDILSSKTALSTLNVGTEYSHDLKNIGASEMRNLLDALQDVFQLALNTGAKIYRKGEDGKVDFDTELIFDIHSGFIVNPSTFPDFLLATEPEKEGSICFEADELILVFR